MPPQQTLNEKVENFKKDLDQIELMLDQIKREYDLYFVGARKRQPYEMRSQIERLLKKWRSSTIQKLELTFRLTSLNSKYNAMVDIWEKVMKRREIDPHALSPFGPTTAQLAAEQSRLNREKEGAAPASPQPTARSAAPVDRDGQMKGLFDQYLDAKKDLGEGVESLNYQKFRAQLDKQVEQLRTKMQCKDVEFSVVKKNGKVTLTAKPIK